LKGEKRKNRTKGKRRGQRGKERESELKGRKRGKKVKTIGTKE